MIELDMAQYTAMSDTEAIEQLQRLMTQKPKRETEPRTKMQSGALAHGVAAMQRRGVTWGMNARYLNILAYLAKYDCAVLMQDKNTLEALETAIGCIKAEQQEKARQKHKMFDGMVKEKIW